MRLYKEVVDVYRAILYMGVKYKMTREKEVLKKYQNGAWDYRNRTGYIGEYLFQYGITGIRFMVVKGI